MCKGERWDFAISDTRIKEVWKEHFENLLNEEFEWNKEGLEEATG